MASASPADVLSRKIWANAARTRERSSRRRLPNTARRRLQSVPDLVGGVEHRVLHVATARRLAREKAFSTRTRPCRWKPASSSPYSRSESDSAAEEQQGLRHGRTLRPLRRALLQEPRNGPARSRPPP